MSMRFFSRVHGCLTHCVCQLCLVLSLTTWSHNVAAESFAFSFGSHVVFSVAQASLRIVMKDNTSQLVQLEEQFEKLGEVMGFDGLDEAVGRCLSQQVWWTLGASETVTPLEADPKF
ncbi:MAG: hypothetical protein SGPRY_011607 [Prymnesium sp.]